MIWIFLFKTQSEQICNPPAAMQLFRGLFFCMYVFADYFVVIPHFSRLLSLFILRILHSLIALRDKHVSLSVYGHAWLSAAEKLTTVKAGVLV